MEDQDNKLIVLLGGQQDGKVMAVKAAMILIEVVDQPFVPFPPQYTPMASQFPQQDTLTIKTLTYRKVQPTYMMDVPDKDGLTSQPCEAFILVDTAITDSPFYQRTQSWVLDENVLVVRFGSQEGKRWWVQRMKDMDMSGGNPKSKQHVEIIPTDVFATYVDAYNMLWEIIKLRRPPREGLTQVWLHYVGTCAHYPTSLLARNRWNRAYNMVARLIDRTFSHRSRDSRRN